MAILIITENHRGYESSMNDAQGTHHVHVQSLDLLHDLHDSLLLSGHRHLGLGSAQRWDVDPDVCQVTDQLFLHVTIGTVDEGVVLLGNVQFLVGLLGLESRTGGCMQSEYRIANQVYPSFISIRIFLSGSLNHNCTLMIFLDIKLEKVSSSRKELQLPQIFKIVDLFIPVHPRSP